MYPENVKAHLYSPHAICMHQEDKKQSMWTIHIDSDLASTSNQQIKAVSEDGQICTRGKLECPDRTLERSYHGKNYKKNSTPRTIFLSLLRD